MTTTPTRGRLGLEEHGIAARGRVVRNPTTSQLYEHALRRGDGRARRGRPAGRRHRRAHGPFAQGQVRRPGARLGGAHLVGRRESSAARGEVRRPAREGRPPTCRPQDPLYVVDAFAGADPAHRIVVRVVTGSPYHALFAKTMFIEPDEDELESLEPQALVLHAPEVVSVPEEDGDPLRDVRRPAPDAIRGARRRNVLRRRDQEVDLHGDERPPAARGRVPDALLRQRRTRTARSRSSSASPGPARRRSRPTRSDR